ncbi:MAG: flagellar biosynthesis protein FlhF [Gammaproteobacteria bacterium]|nr:MAG: flagellar biosynthesis protein FlhF [Gammaproteobacteria bacterium]
MKIKRFSGPDMRSVMAEIRTSFGPSAVILETGRGAGGIEVTAAMDFDPAAYQPPAPRRRIDCRDEDLPEAPPADAAADGGELASMREEMRSIRCLLEAQLARLSWDQQVRRYPEATGIVRNLTRLGLAPATVERLLRAADVAKARDPWTASLKQLVTTLAACDSDLALDGGLYAVVGPTGAGKTTSIAKLAARALAHGLDGQVALISMDGYRVGAEAQLAAFGELLGVPVHRAPDAEALAETLAGLADKRLVLIDTAGMGQRDLRLVRQARQLRDSGHPIELLLALPANLQTPAMQEIVDVYRTAEPLAGILTKIDEAASLGGAFSVLIDASLPLAYVANGQRVPEDLHLARARQAWLVKAAVELIPRSGPPVSEDYLAEHFAEVANDACA